MRRYFACATFALALLSTFAVPVAQADPPKVTMVITNSTSHDARVELNSATTRPWMTVTVRANSEYVAKEILGSFQLTGTIAGSQIAPISVVLNRNSPKRLLIEREQSGRFYFATL